jgi:catechol 2,3-dioxygenase-like lactoylglutathione lyase family enzyme
MLAMMPDTGRQAPLQAARAGVAAVANNAPRPSSCHLPPAPDPKDPAMFSHVMIGTNDLPRAKAFYDALLGTLGVAPGFVDRHRVFWRTPTGVFSVTIPINGQPATVANGSTIGFACASPEQADAWHAAGLANGATTCEDPPGVREGGAGKLYLAYLRDPDGHKICALHRMR